MSSDVGQPIRVLYVLGSLRPGGIETWLMNLLRLKDPRWEIDFFLSDPSRDQGAYYNEALALGAKIYHELPISRFRKRAAMIGLCRLPTRLREVLASCRYDVVHAHGEEFLGDLMSTVHQAGVPIRIAHCHSNVLARGKGGLEMVIRGIRHRTLDRHRLKRHATHMLACSREAGILLVGSAWDSDWRCAVHYCGIPLQPYEFALNNILRTELLSRYNLPPNAIVIGHVGSMGPTPIKNQQFLVKVFAELATRNSRYYLFMAGDGPLRTAIQTQAQQMGLAARVIMPGVVNNVPQLMMKLFDVHVMPSIHEGFGIAVTEATAAGLASVLSTGIPQEVSDSFPGRVERISLASSFFDWADAVERALGNREDPTQALKKFRGTQFSIEGSANQLALIYQASLQFRCFPKLVT